MREYLDMGCPEKIDLGASERVGFDPATAETTSYRINHEECI